MGTVCAIAGITRTAWWISRRLLQLGARSVGAGCAAGVASGPHRASPIEPEVPRVVQQYDGVQRVPVVITETLAEAQTFFFPPPHICQSGTGQRSVGAGDVTAGPRHPQATAATHGCRTWPTAEAVLICQ
ncbi:DUF6087 family protein [Streptomyces sp. FBKL.4005]|uniref:DUF6087 family protein n=1 Tax=Streptomyces sp. FBKL.4005 TaxID=2015515 RepID=UPI001CB89BEF